MIEREDDEAEEGEEIEISARVPAKLAGLKDKAVTSHPSPPRLVRLLLVAILIVVMFKHAATASTASSRPFPTPLTAHPLSSLLF